MRPNLGCQILAFQQLGSLLKSGFLLGISGSFMSSEFLLYSNKGACAGVNQMLGCSAVCCSLEKVARILQSKVYYGMGPLISRIAGFGPVSVIIWAPIWAPTLGRPGSTSGLYDSFGALSCDCRHEEFSKYTKPGAWSYASFVDQALWCTRTLSPNSRDRHFRLAIVVRACFAV